MACKGSRLGSALRCPPIRFLVAEDRNAAGERDQTGPEAQWVRAGYALPINASASGVDGRAAASTASDELRSSPTSTRRES